MYRVLKAEILKNNIDLNAMSLLLGIKTDTLRRKLNKDISINLAEAKLIKESFFPTMTLDYLFRWYG